MCCNVALNTALHPGSVLTSQYILLDVSLVKLTSSYVLRYI